MYIFKATTTILKSFNKDRDNYIKSNSNFNIVSD